MVSHFFKNANLGLHMQNVTRAVAHTFIMGVPQAGGVPFGSAVIQTGSIAKGKENVMRKFKAGYTAALSFYPLPNLFMYVMVPIHLRAPCADVFAFCFSVIISYINST